MPTSDAARPGPPSMPERTPPRLASVASRRAFFGLGGAVTLALAGGRTAFAASTGPSVSTLHVTGGCLAGPDPGERALGASLLRTSGLAATTTATTTATTATAAGPGRLEALDGRRGRIAKSRYINRAGWGADESYRFDAAGNELWVPTYWPVQTLTVHHTADGSTNPDPAARMRSIYRYQAIDEDFGDFGYHFAIDEAGWIYEGRWSGDDGMPGFNADGLMVNAAHVGGYNAGNVGIALLGDFTAALPTPAAYRTLVRLLALLAGWQDVDPLGRVNYVNPISGASADVPAIAGHRDWAVTQCPGNQFAPLLTQLRQDVAAKLPS